MLPLSHCISHNCIPCIVDLRCSDYLILHWPVSRIAGYVCIAPWIVAKVVKLIGEFDAACSFMMQPKADSSVSI
jgi:hypothetical protein